MKKEITGEVLQDIRHKADHNDVTRNLMERAVTTNGIFAVSQNNMLSTTNTSVFSDEVETGDVTDQKETGRCWLFATLNTLRHQMVVDHKLDSLELSESYSYFWDKLEKSNTFYEEIINTTGIPLDDRRLTLLLDYPQADGAWWEDAASVITKYGIVPKSVMPESVATSKSVQLNKLLNRKLRKDALLLRQLANKKTSPAALRLQKEHMLTEVYRILTIAIGTPPQSFDFSYRDKAKKYHRDENITPLEFLKKYSRGKVDNYVSIINDPSPSKAYGKTYTFDSIGSIIGGQRTLFLNADMKTLKNLARKQIASGEAVWFGCDIHADTTKKGYMSKDAYDFNGTFGVDFNLNKAERLMSRDSSINHAVTITGVDIVKNKPRQWKVENSWGKKVGLIDMKGYYTMSDEWFDANGYLVVIRRDLLSDELLKALTQAPEVMPLWDPLYG